MSDRDMAKGVTSVAFQMGLGARQCVSQEFEKVSSALGFLDIVEEILKSPESSRLCATAAVDMVQRYFLRYCEINNLQLSDNKAQVRAAFKKWCFDTERFAHAEFWEHAWVHGDKTRRVGNVLVSPAVHEVDEEDDA